MPRSYTSHREEAFSNVSVNVDGEDPTAVAPSPGIWQMIKHSSRLDAGLAIKYSPALYQVCMHEPSLNRVQPHGMEAISVIE